MTRRDNEHIRVFFHLDTNTEACRNDLMCHFRKHPAKRPKILRSLRFKQIDSRTDSIDRLCAYAVSRNLNLEYFTGKQEIHIDLPKHILSTTSIQEKESHSTTTHSRLSRNEQLTGKIALTTFLGDVIFKHMLSNKQKTNTKASGSLFLKGYIKTVNETRLPDYEFTESTEDKYNRQIYTLRDIFLPQLNGKGQNIAILNIAEEPGIEKHTNLQQQFSSGESLNTEMQLLFMLLPEASITIYHDVSMVSALKTCLVDRVNSPDIIINPYSGFEFDYTNSERNQLNNSLLKAAMSDKTVLSYQNNFEPGKFASKSTPANSPYVLGCQAYNATKIEGDHEMPSSLTFRHGSRYIEAASNQYNLIFWAAQVAKLNQALEFKAGCINYHFVNALSGKHVAGNEYHPLTNLQHISGFQQVHNQLYKALKHNIHS